ncbi:MAG: acyl-CoA thioesterase [Planctomycetes bacterium]|nr:acyl-CoA thioesterase [Planctomycetota bacterium]
MAYEYRYRRRVEFADTDMAGIVHFARLLCFAEEAEHEFLRSLGLSVHHQSNGQMFGFPRLATRFEFLRPLKFEDEVEIHLWVRHKREKTLTYQFRFAKNGDAIAQGEITVICCRVKDGGKVKSVPLPPSYADQIEEAPHAPLEFFEE